MQMVSEVMTRDVRFVSPQESLQRAAQMMDELNVGVLPVCDGERLVGMVTDRDLAVRGMAAGKAPGNAHVDEVMSTDVRWAFADQTLDDLMIRMADSQVRRIPVVSHDDQHKLIGIVSLGDIATRTAADAQKQDVEEVVEMVSSPSAPRRGEGSVDAGGRSGKGDAGAAATGTGSAGMAGTRTPKAGESGGGMGHGAVAGASGDSENKEGGAAEAERTRRSFGVGGQDLTGSGELPPT